jgi:two-component system, response regulator YesN
VHRLLIVDDEPFVVDGLYDYLSGERAEELELYRAASSLDALSIMERIRVDVVVCDIRMPVMSGLELLRTATERWPNTRFLMLTGFDDFSSVYQAIQHAGVSYLLKTEGYERILAAIDAKCREIDHAYRGQAEIERASSLLREVLPRLREEHLAGILEGVTEGPEPSRFADLGIALDLAQPVTLVLGFLRSPAGGDPNAQALTTTRLSTERVLAEAGEVESTTLRHDVAFLLQAEASGESLRETLERAALTSELGAAVDVSFIVSPAAVSWRELPFAAQEMRRSWYGRPDRATVIIFQEEAALDARGRRERGRAAGRIKAGLSRLQRLEVLLDRGQRNEILAELTAITGGMVEAAACSLDLLAEARAGLSLFFLAYLRANGLADNLAPRDLVERLQQLDRDTAASLADLYLRVVEAILEARRLHQEDRARAAVERVKAYVDAHLDGDLSLEHMADIAFFSPKYLSRVFRQVSGEGYLEYMNARRLARAKELLALREWKINRIGVEVGFTTPPYFTRFFKRLTGSSPQEYRDSLAREKGEQR